MKAGLYSIFRKPGNCVILLPDRSRIVGENEMRRTVHIVITALIMLVVSRFMVRIVDATVGIDQDFGILVLFLIIVNTLIGFIAYRCCRRS